MESKDPIVREGFRVLRDRYSTPADSAQLAAEIKRKIAICHLFLNYKLPIHEVAKTLDETYKRAVNILIEQGIIQERRSLSRDEHQPKLSLFSSRLKNPE
jgi:hypothetical protein